ncbi:MAG: ATP-binding cassette domain-containing protein [Clostridia bacterium]|nr:ATP-binding cassette domain-containing protein [Clostridia bacterium]
MAYVEFKKVSFKYSVGDGFALRDVDLSIEKGEILLLTGASGSGKTTLLRLLKPQIRPEGALLGEILLDGKDIFGSDNSVPASKIGYVSQSPEDQTVTDTVAHELAFGLESAGIAPAEIRRRVAEICGFFGIEDLYGRRMGELSGGEIQIVELAAAMAGDPELLLLDEPTSQLDPIAAGEFFSVLRRINTELGVTVIISEHRTEEVFSIADKTAIMAGDGTISFFGTPRRAAAEVLSENTEERPAGADAVKDAIPSAARIFASLECRVSDDIPLTVREGREYIERTFSFASESDIEITNPAVSVGSAKKKTAGEGWRDQAVVLRDVHFRYEREQSDVICGLDLEVASGQVYAILGGNGTGKSTLLRIISGTEKPYRGKKQIRGRSAGLPQDPRMIFTEETVAENLIFAAQTGAVGAGDSTDDDGVLGRAVAAAVNKFGLGRLLKRHPYDLSGGERQRAALAMLLLTGAEILLLDEPTSGLDSGAKKSLGRLLRSLSFAGVTVIAVTHDLEFAASFADRCGMLFDGKIVCSSPCREFFAGNKFYTTPSARIARPFEAGSGIISGDEKAGAVTVSDVVSMCRRGMRKKDSDIETDDPIMNAESENNGSSGIISENNNTEKIEKEAITSDAEEKAKEGNQEEDKKSEVME